jgi:tetratricopeptide (TPR) repeat protein
MTEGPVIGLHMIVRDETAVVARCLSSVAPHVDRVMIVDTGSTDDTREAAADAADEAGHQTVLVRSEADSYGGCTAVVESMEWPNDFAKARQRALDRMLQLWPEITHVVWCDADDVLAGAEHLRAWAARLPEQAGGYMGHYAYGFDPSGNLTITHHRERLLRREAVGQWVGSIHENLQLQPGAALVPLPVPMDSQLGKLGAAWPHSHDGVEWRHHPSPTRNSLGRNRAIIEAQLADVPEDSQDPRLLFYLAQEYAVLASWEHAEHMRAGEHDKAQEAFMARARHAAGLLVRHGQLSQPSDERYQAAHRLADLYRAMGNPQDALQVDLANTQANPAWPDSWHGAAESYLSMAQWDLAVTYTNMGLARPYPSTHMILDPTDYTLKPWSVLARAYAGQSNWDEALRHAQRVVSEAPHDQVAAGLLVQVEQDRNDAVALQCLLTLDQWLAANDENLKAAQLLTDCVPYRLANHPVVGDRRRRRRLGVRHVLPDQRDDDYGQFYTDPCIHPAVFCDLLGMPDQPVEASAVMHDRFARLSWLAAQVKAEWDRLGYAPHVVDVGCHDGWVGMYLAHHMGVTYQGWDLNPDAVATANRLADMFPPESRARMTFTNGDAWAEPLSDRRLGDVVSSFEVIEHVPDPREWARKLAQLGQFQTSDKLGALVCISTPDGAYERGRISEWDVETPRGHVRALAPQDMAAIALDLGTLHDLQRLPDRTQVTAYRRRERIGTLDMYLGGAGQAWEASDLWTKGLGGSETMAIRMATRMAEQGWRVRVYGAVPNPGTVAQVEYLPWYGFDPTERRDVLVVSRQPGVAAWHPNAGMRVLWLHDADYPDLAQYARGWDEIWCVGVWQAQHLLGVDLADTDVPLDDQVGAPLVRWMRNGVDHLGYQYRTRSWADRNPWVLYSSSPDRGAHYLLGMWEDIYQQCWAKGVRPQLHLAYGFSPTYQAMEQHAPHLQDIRRQVEEGRKLAGVVWHGGMPQPALADLQQRSRVWAYPSDFPEVSCITAMEAQTAGMAALYCRNAELPRTMGSAGVGFPPYSEWTDDNRREFVAHVVGCLTDAGTWGSCTNNPTARAWALDVQAERWHLLVANGKSAWTGSR